MSLSSCASPVTGEVMFEMAPKAKWRSAWGCTARSARGRQKALSADETIDLMLPPILEDLPFQAGDEALVLLNNSGSLTLMELFILYRRVEETAKLRQADIKVYKIPGSVDYATTLEAAGFAISLCRVDDQLKALWDAPANGAYMKQAMMTIATGSN